VGDLGVRGHPSRIALPWWSRDLPPAPGLAAGVAELDSSSPWGMLFEQGWYLVAPEGSLWRIPTDLRSGAAPSLSPNGRFLGYLQDGAGYVIRDLVTGQVTSFPDLGSSDAASTRRWFVNGQSPSFWSPDSSQLLVRAAGRLPDEPFDVVLGVDGSSRRIGEPGYPAGWLGAATLVWLVTPEQAVDLGPDEVMLLVTDLGGSRLRDYQVALPGRGTGLNQWSAASTADGDSVLVSFATPDGLRSLVLGVSSRTVRESAPVDTRGALERCQLTPATDRVSLATAAGGRVTVSTLGGGELLKTDPRLQVACLTLARDAVDGDPVRTLADKLAQGGRLGLWAEDSWVSWHLRELALGGGLPILAAVLWWWRRRRAAVRCGE
jgi:hypothetical protein